MAPSGPGGGVSRLARATKTTRIPHLKCSPAKRSAAGTHHEPTKNPVNITGFLSLPLAKCFRFRPENWLQKCSPAKRSAAGTHPAPTKNPVNVTGFLSLPLAKRFRFRPENWLQ